MNYKGTIVSGDLEENTVTIEMDKPIILKAGEYVVIPIEEFKQQIVKAFMKNLPIEDGVIMAVQKAEQYYNETFKK
jgi:hypothetical protein